MLPNTDYFKVVARVPRGRGLWPAIWLLPGNGSWPPGIDAPEVLSDNTDITYYSPHSQDRACVSGQKDSYANAFTTDTVRAEADLSEGLHRYDVGWRTDNITLYLDNRKVAQRSTPSDMQKLFYLLVILAVGGKGSWPGPPDAATKFPASLIIQPVDVWASP